MAQSGTVSQTIKEQDTVSESVTDYQRAGHSQGECHRLSKSRTQSGRVSQTIKEQDTVRESVTNYQVVWHSQGECHRLSRSRTQSGRVSQTIKEQDTVRESVTAIQSFHMVLRPIMMYHKTKFGYKRVSSS